MNLYREDHTGFIEIFEVSRVAVHPFAGSFTYTKDRELHSCELEDYIMVKVDGDIIYEGEVA